MDIPEYCDNVSMQHYHVKFVIKLGSKVFATAVQK